MRKIPQGGRNLTHLEPDCSTAKSCIGTLHRAAPSSSDLPLGFDPRGALVVVRNAAGEDVLAVQLANTGSVSGGDVICCIPDDDLAVGSYQATVSSGANTASAPAHPTVGDEVQFDFDSDPGDIAAGATAIDPSFIQGKPPQVTGTILTLGGGVVAQATADCLVK